MAGHPESHLFAVPDEEYVSGRQFLAPERRELIASAIENGDDLEELFSEEEIAAYYSDPNAPNDRIYIGGNDAA